MKMKIKALIKRKVKGKKIDSMVNEKYKKLSETSLKDKIAKIKKAYSDSFSEASNFYVR
jgi:hypothetical protein